MNAQSSLPQDRLTAEMGSFRLLVFGAVREYIGAFGHSPSVGEIANRLKVSKTRVRDALKSQVRDGFLLRTPGPRGLRLPSVREEAIRQLRELGYVVDEDIGKILPPDPLRALSTLLPPPELDYPSRRRTGDIDGEQGGQGAGESTRDAA